MKKNDFFNATPLYKEYMLLNYIEKNSEITQRSIGETMNVAVSMVNTYLDDCESKRYILRTYVNTKNVTYTITDMGIERMKYLNLGFLEASQEIYYSAKENIVSFLNQLIINNIYNIAFYGAGEIAEIINSVILSEFNSKIKVVAIIDDDIKKQKKRIMDTSIVSIEEICKFDYDAIMITNYSNRDVMYSNLLEMNISKDKIVQFF